MLKAKSEPRSARAQSTRRRLIDAAAPAFAQKGLAGTKLKDDVLDPAGISAGSFYYQFDDKVDLLLAVLEDYSSAYRDRLRGVHRVAPVRSLVDLYRDSYELLFDLAETCTDVLRIQLKERHSDDERVRNYILEDRQRWLTHLSEDFERLARAAGATINCDDAAELVVALSVGALARYLEASEAERPAVRARLSKNLVRFTAGGLDALATGPAESAEGHSEEEHQK